VPQQQPPPGGGVDEARDATRRTHLANERTYLAWWRTGITALAGGLGAGKLVPSLTHEARWPYVVLGSGFAVLGIALILYGYVRQRSVNDAIRRGEFESPDRRVLAALSAAATILGLLLIAVVIVQA
jgi:putative membrane protein